MRWLLFLGENHFESEHWMIRIAKQLKLEINDEFPWSSKALMKRFPHPFSRSDTSVLVTLTSSGEIQRADLPCNADVITYFLE
jgi:hypothetical protein